MRWFLGVALILCIAGLLRADDLAEMQGYWVSLDDPWSVEIQDDVATFRGEHPFNPYGNPAARLHFTLDETARPRQLVLDPAEYQSVMKKPKVTDYDPRIAIYRVFGDQMMLQFVKPADKSKEFEHRVGAPGNHARPMNRRLRRLPAWERAAMQRLTGVWKAEVQAGKLTILADAFFIEPGWLRSSQHIRCRFQLLEPDDHGAEFTLLLQRHVSELKHDFFGGSFTTHDWQAGIGHLTITDQQLSGELSWLVLDKRLEDSKFQTTAALDWDDVKNVREQKGLAEKHRSSLSFAFTKAADVVPYRYGHLPDLQGQPSPSEEQLNGEWQVIQRKDFRTFNGKTIGSLASLPRNEHWSIRKGECQLQQGDESTKLRLTRGKQFSLDIAALAEPEKKLGIWEVRYEPHSQLLFVKRSEWNHAAPIVCECVLERITSTKHK